MPPPPVPPWQPLQPADMNSLRPASTACSSPLCRFCSLPFSVALTASMGFLAAAALSALTARAKTNVVTTMTPRAAIADLFTAFPPLAFVAERRGRRDRCLSLEIGKTSCTDREKSATALFRGVALAIDELASPRTIGARHFLLARRRQYRRR
jgi:hypothetical protein